MPSPDFDSWIPSPNCKPSTGGNVVALAVHDEEYPELDTSAEDVGLFFQNPGRQASTTGVIDNNSKVQCVEYGDTAWHTGHGDPWNFRIEGYEHSGYARQSEEEWLDPYGVEMLERSAAHYAKRCHDLGIPVRKIDGAQLRQAVLANDPAQGGICGHKDISDATDGGHYDPGYNFPWDYFIARVQAHYDDIAAGSPAPVPTPAPVTPDPVIHRRNGAIQGATVTEIQGFLKAVADSVGESDMDPGPADGVFGPRTERAVMAFQQRAKDADGNPLEVDGIVGPKTIVSLRVCAYIAAVGAAVAVPVHSVPVPPLPRVMSNPCNGPDATRLQQQLSDRTWTITVDGFYGGDTEAVVRQFQADKGLRVDGITGPNTWAALWMSPLT